MEEDCLSGSYMLLTDHDQLSLLQADLAVNNSDIYNFNLILSTFVPMNIILPTNWHFNHICTVFIHTSPHLIISHLITGNGMHFLIIFFPITICPFPYWKRVAPGSVTSSHPFTFDRSLASLSIFWPFHFTHLIPSKETTITWAIFFYSANFPLFFWKLLH